jgi:hypothetical protein
MTSRNLMTSLLALTLMVFVGGCDSESDGSGNIATFDLGPYCGEGTGLNDDGTQCVANLALDVNCGQGTELNAEDTQCVPVYDCFRGGFCSKAAVEGFLSEGHGNSYAGDTLESSGCSADPSAWARGVELVLASWAKPSTYADMCH